MNTESKKRHSMRLRIQFKVERRASAEGVALFDLKGAVMLRVDLRRMHLHLMAFPKVCRYLGAFCPVREKTLGRPRPVKSRFPR